MTSNNPSNLFTLANIELQKAAEWFQANKLTLNVKKTKYILFRNKANKIDFNNLKLDIGGENIERIGSDCKDKFFKFVGYHLDEFLTWEHQINHVHSKLSGSNYAIASIKNFAPIKIRKTLYNSFFRSHLEFPILAFGGMSSNKLKRLTLVQKKCIRNVCGTGYLSHTEPLFYKMNILKVEDLFAFNAAKLVFKLNNELLPESFNNFLIPFSQPNRTNSYVINKPKSDHLKQFPTYILPIIWNNLNYKLKLESKFSTFKRELLDQLLAKYKPLT